MATVAPRSEKKVFELVEAGTNVGILWQIIHLGTLKSTFNGEEKTAYKIRLTFELPGITKVWKEGQEAKPASISSKITLSMYSKAKLRPLVEGIIGTSLPDDVAESFDIEDLLGKPCLLNIKHETMKDGKVFASIAGTSPLMKGMEAPKQYNPNKVINLFQKWDEEVYKGLPEFIRKDIDASLERNKKPSKVQDEVNKFDAQTIVYPEGEDPNSIPF